MGPLDKILEGIPIKGENEVGLDHDQLINLKEWYDEGIIPKFLAGVEPIIRKDTNWVGPLKSLYSNGLSIHAFKKPAAEIEVYIVDKFDNRIQFVLDSSTQRSGHSGVVATWAS